MFAIARVIPLILFYYTIAQADGKKTKKPKTKSDSARDEDNYRIVGGRPVFHGPQRYPWFARPETVDHRGVRRKWAKCGGSLVSPEYVLTARHCLNGNDKFVQDGGYMIGSLCRFGSDPEDNCNQPQEWRTIRNVTMFPRTGGHIFENDYALVRLTEESTIRYVDMDDGESMDYTEATKLWVVGYGDTKTVFHTKGEGYLQHTRMNYVDNDSCERELNEELKKEREGTTVSVTEDMMCVADWRKASCQGDSGGPLYNRQTESLVGIVTFGLPSCKRGAPAVYARIATQHVWLKHTICNNHNDPLPEFCDDICNNHNDPLPEFCDNSDEEQSEEDDNDDGNADDDIVDGGHDDDEEHSEEDDSDDGNADGDDDEEHSEEDDSDDGNADDDDGIDDDEEHSEDDAIDDGNADDDDGIDDDEEQSEEDDNDDCNVDCVDDDGDDDESNSDEENSDEPTPTPSPTPKSTPIPTYIVSSEDDDSDEEDTDEPTSTPTLRPTPSPTSTPTLGPTSSPTSTPTLGPTSSPTSTPTLGPTSSPTSKPTSRPTPTRKNNPYKCDVINTCDNNHVMFKIELTIANKKNFQGVQYHLKKKNDMKNKFEKILSGVGQSESAIQCSHICLGTGTYRFVMKEVEIEGECCKPRQGRYEYFIDDVLKLKKPLNTAKRNTGFKLGTMKRI